LLRTSDQDTAGAVVRLCSWIRCSAKQPPFVDRKSMNIEGSSLPPTGAGIGGAR
jgi:hypothetical protein